MLDLSLPMCAWLTVKGRDRQQAGGGLQGERKEGAVTEGAAQGVSGGWAQGAAAAVETFFIWFSLFSRSAECKGQGGRRREVAVERGRQQKEATSAQKIQKKERQLFSLCFFFCFLVF